MESNANHPKMADDQVNPRGMERVFFTLRLRRMHYGSTCVYLLAISFASLV